MTAGRVAEAGETILYSLAITNTGTQNATGVVMTDTVPAHTTFNAGASSAGWSCADGAPAGTPCAFDLSAVIGGQFDGDDDLVVLVTFAVDVVDPLPPGVTQIDNTIVVSDDGSNGPDQNPSDNSHSETTPVINSATLTLIKTASPEDGTDFAFTSDIPSGANFTLDVDSDNTLQDRITFNDLPVGSYSITEILPADWLLANATCTGGSDSGSLTAETLTVALAAGETVECTFSNTFAPPTDINARLDLDSVQTNYNPTPAPNAPKGIYTISLTFRNISAATLNNLHFEVATLTNGNLLLNADGGPAGSGAILSIPPTDLGPDEVLSPNETFTVDFEIGLAVLSAFDFFVDAFGVVVDGVTSTSLADSDGFDFEFDPAQSQSSDNYEHYMPIIVK